MANFSIRLTVSRSLGVGEGLRGFASFNSSGFQATTLVAFFLPFFLPLALVGLFVPAVKDGFIGVEDAATVLDGKFLVGLATSSSSSSAAAAFLADAILRTCILK